MTTITPFTGWLLDRSVEIDEHCPGFSGHLHRCSSERRHIIAAYLSCDVPAAGLIPLVEMGSFLTSATHDSILCAGFEFVPQGYRGALGRGDAQPYSRRYYRYLHSLMSSTLRPSMTRLIHRLSRVDPLRLKIARILPADLRHVNLVTAIKTQQSARDVADLFGLLQEAGADREAMARALANVDTGDQIRAWAQRWALRVRLPEHPAPPSDEYHPVCTAEELKRLAVRHRNCMRSYLPNVLEQRSAFSIVGEGKASAVVHLVRQRGRWVVDDVYGSGNSTPSPKLVEQAMSHLRRHDIVSRIEQPRLPPRWAPLRRIAGHFDYEQDWEME